jgi:hypothetical protein
LPLLNGERVIPRLSRACHARRESAYQSRLRGGMVGTMSRNISDPLI